MAAVLFLQVMTDVALFSCPARRPSGRAREIRVTIDQTVNTAGGRRRRRRRPKRQSRACSRPVNGTGAAGGAGRGRRGCSRTRRTRRTRRQSRPGVPGTERGCPAWGGLGPAREKGAGGGCRGIMAVHGPGGTHLAPLELEEAVEITGAERGAQLRGALGVAQVGVL